MRRFTTQFLTAFSVAALLSVVGVASAPRLIAAVKAALVQNIDEPGRNPYQEKRVYSFTGFCGGNFCEVDFAAVPAGSRLVITNVSGSITLQGGVSVQEIYLSEAGNGTGVVKVNVPTESEGTVSGTTSRQFNRQIHLYVEQFQTPSINVSLTGNPGTSVQSVSLVGYYVKL